jgi:hypothetical protein
MRTTIDRIEAGKILPPDQLTRLGLGPRRSLRVVVETVDAGDDEINITEMNAQVSCRRTRSLHRCRSDRAQCKFGGIRA